MRVPTLILTLCFWMQPSLVQANAALPASVATMPAPTAPTGKTGEKLEPVIKDEPVSEDDEVIRIESDVIRVPIRYNSRDGQPLPFPEKSDLIVKVGGKEVTDFDLDQRNSSFTVSMLVDVSGSMAGRIESTVKPALEHFVNRLDDRDFAAVISFSGEARLQSGKIRADGKRNFFTSADAEGRRGLLDSVRGLQLGGATALWDAVASVAQRFQGPYANTNKILFILSDGADNSSKLDSSALSEYFAETGITLFFVNIDDGSGTGEIFDALARASGGIARTVRQSADLNDLKAAIDQTIADIRARPVLSFMAGDDWEKDKKLFVKVSRKSGAREGVFSNRSNVCFGKKCPQDLIDFSGGATLTPSRAQRSAIRMAEDGVLNPLADKRLKTRFSAPAGARVVYQQLGTKLESIDPTRQKPLDPYCLFEANDTVAGTFAGPLASKDETFRVDSARGLTSFAMSPFDAATLKKLGLDPNYFVSYVQIPLVSEKGPTRNAILLCGWPARLIGPEHIATLPKFLEPMFNVK